jgi:hypothetical protein
VNQIVIIKKSQNFTFAQVLQIIIKKLSNMSATTRWEFHLVLKNCQTKQHHYCFRVLIAYL